MKYECGTHLSPSLPPDRDKTSGNLVWIYLEWRIFHESALSFFRTPDSGVFAGEVLFRRSEVL